MIRWNNEGLKLLKPGGVYAFAGMVQPKSQLNVTGELIIQKCLTIKGDKAHLDKAIEFLHRSINIFPFQSNLFCRVIENKNTIF